MVHNYSMNTQRITVSLPKYIHEELLIHAGKRQLSHFVAEAVEEHLLDQKIAPNDPIAKFIGLRSKLPKISGQEILEAVRKGRI